MFTFVSRSKDLIDSRAEFDQQTFQVDGLKLGSDGGLIDPNTCIYFDLTNKSYEVKQQDEVIADGWRVTKNKLKVDLVEGKTQPTNGNDLLSYYDTHGEKDCAVLMPVPSYE